MKILQYLYAFTINPMATMDRSELVKIPPEATECPYFKKMNQESAGRKSIAQMSVESLVQDNNVSEKTALLLAIVTTTKF